MPFACRRDAARDVGGRLGRRANERPQACVRNSSHSWPLKCTRAETEALAFAMLLRKWWLGTRLNRRRRPFGVPRAIWLRFAQMPERSISMWRSEWWWPGTGLNRRRRPFQGRALPLSYLANADLLSESGSAEGRWDPLTVPCNNLGSIPSRFGSRQTCAGPSPDRAKVTAWRQHCPAPN